MHRHRPRSGAPWRGALSHRDTGFQQLGAAFSQLGLGQHQLDVYGAGVNLAARLEAMTKEAGRGLLVDAATHAALGESVAADALGSHEVRGHRAPVEVFAIGA